MVKIIKSAYVFWQLSHKCVLFQSWVPYHGKLHFGNSKKLSLHFFNIHFSATHKDKQSADTETQVQHDIKLKQIVLCYPKVLL